MLINSYKAISIILINIKTGNTIKFIYKNKAA
jgi:hypothetical protein